MRLSNITIDPDFRDYFPPLEPDAYEALKDKIIHEGFTDPVKLWSVGYNNYLLDGHHRYQICKELGIEPRHVFIKCADKKAALEWIKNNQRARRNTSVFQDVEHYLANKQAIADQAKLNQQKALKRGDQSPVVPMLAQRGESNGRTNEQIAKQAGVGKETVRKVEKILDSGDTEIIDKARSGVMSVDAAYKAVNPKKAKQDKPETVAVKSEEQQLIDDAMEGTSLESIIDDLSKQNEQLIRTLDAVNAKDKEAKIREQQEVMYGYEQRINMLTKETYEKDKQLRWQNNILRELLKLLGIDRYADIIGEVRKLKGL